MLSEPNPMIPKPRHNLKVQEVGEEVGSAQLKSVQHLLLIAVVPPAGQDQNPLIAA